MRIEFHPIEDDCASPNAKRYAWWNQRRGWRRAQARMQQTTRQGRIKRVEENFLDEEELPALLLHHVPPVDALVLSSARICIVDMPDIAKQLTDAAE